MRGIFELQEKLSRSIKNGLNSFLHTSAGRLIKYLKQYVEIGEKLNEYRIAALLILFIFLPCLQLLQAGSWLGSANGTTTCAASTNLVSSQNNE